MRTKTVAALLITVSIIASACSSRTATDLSRSATPLNPVFTPRSEDDLREWSPDGFDVSDLLKVVQYISDIDAQQIVALLPDPQVGQHSHSVIATPDVAAVSRETWDEATRTSKIETFAVDRSSGRVDPLSLTTASVRADGGTLVTTEALYRPAQAELLEADPMLGPSGLGDVTEVEMDRLERASSVTYLSAGQSAMSCSSHCNTLQNASQVIDIAICAAVPGALALGGGWAALGAALLCGVFMLGKNAIFGAACDASCNDSGVPKAALQPQNMRCEVVRCSPTLDVEFGNRTVSGYWSETNIRWHSRKLHPCPTGGGSCSTLSYIDRWSYPWGQVNGDSGSVTGKSVYAILNAQYPNFARCTTGLDFQAYFSFTDGSFVNLNIRAYGYGVPGPLYKDFYPYSPCQYA